MFTRDEIDVKRRVNVNLSFTFLLFSEWGVKSYKSKSQIIIVLIIIINYKVIFLPKEWKCNHFYSEQHTFF